MINFPQPYLGDSEFARKLDDFFRELLRRGLDITQFPIYVDYVNSRVGIGGLPDQSGYLFQIVGDTRFEGNVLITGNLTINGNLELGAGSGLILVHSDGTTKFKLSAVTRDDGSKSVAAVRVG